MQFEHKIIKKDIRFIYNDGVFGLMQRKVINSLIKNTQENIDNKRRNYVSISDLRNNAQVNSNNYTNIINSTKDLSEIPARWHIFNENYRHYKEYTFLSEYEKKAGGSIVYKFHDYLEIYVHEPVVFVLLNLEIVNSLKSKYSIALYEHCRAKMEGVGIKGWIDIEDFKKIIGLGASPIDGFSRFRYTVVDPAIKEINEKTDIKIKAFYRKEGRSIKYISLSVNLKNDNKKENWTPSKHQFLMIEKYYDNLWNLAVSEKDILVICKDVDEDSIEEFIEQRTKELYPPD